MILTRACILVALGLAIGLAMPGHSMADMLDEPACTALKSEQARLAASGLKTEMLHGPDWAKANLPQSRLQEIKHLMEVEEQINFRCPLPPPPKAPQPATGAADADGKGEQPKAAKKKKGKKQREEATFEIPQIDFPTPDPDPAVEKPKKAKTKPKKEPANDAYVPPAAQGNAFVDGEADPVPKAAQP